MHAAVLSGEVHQAPEAAGDPVDPTQMQRIEQTEMDVRMGGEQGDLLVATITGRVVEQDTDTYATIGGLQQFLEQQAGAEPVVDQVILQVDTALGRVNQLGAGGEGLAAVGQQAEAGLPGGMRFGQPLDGFSEPGALGRQRLAGRPWGRAGAAGEAEYDQHKRRAYIRPPDYVITSERWVSA
ncbi:hypothetical protein GCM10027514_35790 [Azotobacter armeniacus]